MAEIEIWPGRPYPLGATWDGEGTNFAVFSDAARGGSGVELCLFDGDGERRAALPEVTAHVWHGYVPGVGAGQPYGFRVHGPFWPQGGMRCDGAKLLLDPYARAIDGTVDYTGPVFGTKRGDPYSPDGRNSAAYVPRSVVVDPSFDWGDDRRPRTPLNDALIYEVHVRGFTMLHPDVPPELRGTYAGLATEPVIEHLKGLGVTAVELMPVHHFVSEPHVVGRGLSNYWGYSSVGFFAPHAAYSSSGTRGEQVVEFKSMVKALHSAGIEVILDVVYNHTGEGDENGPVLMFRGLDNSTYYRLEPSDPSRYLDYTGTGNTVNARHPEVLRLIMASLRYWITEMHVDGFRFDLASALARDPHEVDRLSSFFDVIYQDPLLRDVHLIAEPWDVGDRGYQVGNFPLGWAEWNDRYRDGVRDFWRGRSSTLADVGFRLTGSSDLYEHDGRRPFASVNFVTAHDGFTLKDLVSYNRKHNEANGEGNADGMSRNRSWNCGVEGQTGDPDITALRNRQRRNFIATLLLSQGIPMLLGGDELGRTQRGNNNAYCQDNEISWFSWTPSADDCDFLEFVRRTAALRSSNRVFRRSRFLTGRSPNGGPLPDAAWFRPDGREMAHDNWLQRGRRTLGLFLNGREIGERGSRGEALDSDSFLLLLNAAARTVAFTLPGSQWGDVYEAVLDTTLPRGVPERPRRQAAADAVELVDRSLLVLKVVA